MKELIGKKIVLGDETEIDIKAANSGTRNYKNKTRRYIEFVFDAEKNSIDNFAKMFSDEKFTRKIKIKDIYFDPDKGENGEQTEEEFIYLDYEILIEICQTSRILKDETNQEPVVYENVINIVLGQLTYTEIENRQMLELVEAQTEVLADLIGGAE